MPRTVPAALTGPYCREASCLLSGGPSGDNLCPRSQVSFKLVVSLSLDTYIDYGLWYPLLPPQDLKPTALLWHTPFLLVVPGVDVTAVDCRVVASVLPSDRFFLSPSFWSYHFTLYAAPQCCCPSRPRVFHSTVLMDLVCQPCTRNSSPLLPSCYIH